MVAIPIPDMTCGGCAKGAFATPRDAAPLLAALRAEGWQAEAAG
jgi:hypothetical protein